jgi:hypothetical protein
MLQAWVDWAGDQGPTWSGPNEAPCMVSAANGTDHDARAGRYIVIITVIILGLRIQLVLSSVVAVVKR